MKRLLLPLSLVLLFSVLSANPVAPKAMARVWFNDAGQFLALMGGKNGQIYYQDHFQDMVFTTSAGTYTFPESFIPPTSWPFIINLSEAISGFEINSLEDHLTLDIPGLGWFGEEISWGEQNNISIDMHPLSPGQSAVQIRSYNWDGYDTVTWAKDYGNYDNSYVPEHSCNLSVNAVNEQGSPVAGVLVQYSCSDYLPEMNWAFFHTDNTGLWQLTQYAYRTWLRIKDPLTYATVLDTLLYTEPDSTYHFNVVVSSVAADDPVLAPGSGVLTLSPSVLNHSSGNNLHLKFEANNALIHPGELTLYDLRGRALANMQMPVTGQTEWTLHSLSSGIYFIGLSYSGKQLARQRLTVIK